MIDVVEVFDGSNDLSSLSLQKNQQKVNMAEYIHSHFNEKKAIMIDIQKGMKYYPSGYDQ